MFVYVIMAERQNKMNRNKAVAEQKEKKLSRIAQRLDSLLNMNELVTLLNIMNNTQNRTMLRRGLMQHARNKASKEARRAVPTRVVNFYP